MVFFSTWKRIIQYKYDYYWIIIINNTMNTIKFLPNNKIQLTMFNKTILLNKIKYSKEYSSYYTIKNNNYA